ncbi:hypothetical protein EJB05_52664, partial [Eragrostis curvula]
MQYYQKIHSRKDQDPDVEVPWRRGAGVAGAVGDEARETLPKPSETQSHVALPVKPVPTRCVHQCIIRACMHVTCACILHTHVHMYLYNQDEASRWSSIILQHPRLLLCHSLRRRCQVAAFGRAKRTPCMFPTTTTTSSRT